MGRNFTWRADGQAGQDGHDGHDGRPGGFGQAGMRGTDATAPSAGGPGGGVLIRIATAASDETLDPLSTRLSGRRHAGDARPEWGAPVGEALPLEELGEVIPSAVGGDGGNGGNGGQGGDGGAGVQGQNASPNQAGGNGGPGGRGGDGGRGSSGAPGGPGGHIHIALEAVDLPLLMAVRGADRPRSLVAGGAGGAAGVHGTPGAGGEGGAGGAPSQRTEYRPVTKWRKGSDDKLEPYTVQEAYSVPVPGGRAGKSGAPGRAPNPSPTFGPQGRQGVFTLSVREADGTVTSHENVSRYDLAIRAFECQEADQRERDGVFEFGERVEVIDVLVDNPGGIATPRQHPGVIRLEDGPWVRPQGGCLLVAGDLAPDDEREVPGALEFVLGGLEATAPGPPLEAVIDVVAVADQLGPAAPGMPPESSPFQRRYTEGRHSVRLQARYPVANHEGADVERSLPRGSVTQWRLPLANISSLPIGVASDRQRPVAVFIEMIDSDADIADVVAMDERGRRVDLSSDRWHGANGLLRQVPYLPAGEEGAAELMLGFGEATPVQAGARFRASVWLGAVNEPGAWVRAQIREWSMRCRPGRKLTRASDVVLVVNDGTTRAEYERWRELFRSMGLTCDDWSVNETGHLLFRDGDDDVRELLRNTLVVVLNQPFHPGRSDRTAFPADCLDYRQVRQIATEYGAKVLMVGDGGYSAEEVIAPASAEPGLGDEYDDVEGCTTALVHQPESSKALARLTEAPFREDPTRAADTVTVTAMSLPGMRPSRKALDRVARQLLRTLSKAQPNQRFVVVRRPARNIEQDGRLLGIFPRWRIGDLEVRRSLDRDESATICLPVRDGEGPGSASFIEGRRVRYGLLLGLSFEHKLAALRRLLRAEARPDAVEVARARLVAAALMADLCTEQCVLRREVGQRGGPSLSSPADFAAYLPKLHALTALAAGALFGPTAPPPGARQWDIVIELVAALKVLNRSQSRWWHWWGANRRITRFVRDKVAAWQLDVIASAVADTAGGVGPDLPRVEERIAEQVVELRSEVRGHRKELRSQADAQPELRIHSGSSPAAAEDYFARHTARRLAVHPDATALVSESERIWSAQDLSRRGRKERSREVRQKELRDLHDTEAPTSRDARTG